MTVTPLRLDVLCWIARHVATVGYSPTIKEIGKALHIASTSAVNHHLDKLVDRGLITRARRTARSLLLTAAGKVAAAS